MAFLSSSSSRIYHLGIDDLWDNRAFLSFSSREREKVRFPKTTQQSSIRQLRACAITTVGIHQEREKRRKEEDFCIIIIECK